MCSISGIARISNSRLPDLKSSVRLMNAALRHRGPDGHGVFEYRSESENFELVLGNTRLAIIDTSNAGHQPMVDQETGNCITYNGEAYNFRELRREIGEEFGPWQSKTDTEVVLRAYRKWGIAGIGRLRGMFALAIWDQTKSELILARDSFGIKPLYYFAGTNLTDASYQFVFSSEIRALLSSGLVERQMSRKGVASYLTYGSFHSPETVIENVHSLMPGECMIVKPTGRELNIRKVSINNVADSTIPNFTSRDEAVIELRKLLEQSVRAHLISDVPLGVFLSGGMDSSSLVALISRVSEVPPKTFSIVFEESRFSESTHSRMVANQFRTEHRELVLQADRLLALLSEAIKSFDQPSMDGINTYVVSKAVKDAGITVALSGLGGDELFAGYPSFRRLLRVQSTSDVTKRFLRTVSGAGSLVLNGSGKRKKFWQLAASNGTPEDVYRITRQLFPPETIKNLTSDSFDDPLDHRTNGSGFDPINEMSRLELQGYMANTLLRDTDSMSMAHSLEVRVPFVDVDVVGYVRTIPGSWKLNGHPKHVAKPLLADAVSNLLPKDFMLRRKMGFTLPFEKWLQAHLRNEVDSVLSDSTRLKVAGLDAENVGKVWRSFLKSPSNVGWSRPWSLYVLAKWCEVNRVSVE